MDEASILYIVSRPFVYVVRQADRQTIRSTTTTSACARCISYILSSYPQPAIRISVSCSSGRRWYDLRCMRERSLTVIPSTPRHRQARVGSCVCLHSNFKRAASKPWKPSSIGSPSYPTTPPQVCPSIPSTTRTAQVSLRDTLTKVLCTCLHPSSLQSACGGSYTSSLFPLACEVGGDG